MANTEATKNKKRSVANKVRGIPTLDGAGVTLTRVIGAPELEMLDPFLLLDVFESDNPDDYIAGFPSHPHRGFETVTYMLAGQMRHEDNTKRSGVIGPGGVQWMTAGRGIVHSEMPEQKAGLMRGFQLWVNLPSAKKMIDPHYREYSSEEIPVELREAGVEVRVIAGTTQWGTRGPVTDVVTEPLLMDVRLARESRFVESVPRSHSAFLFVVEGQVLVTNEQDNETQVIDSRSLAVLGDGDQIEIVGVTDKAHVLMVAGLKLNEPVARAGPFVMNTKAEVLQAFQDFRMGVF